MAIIHEKTFFTGFLPESLGKADPAAKPRWGKLSLQQMTEHLADSFLVAGNKIHLSLAIPEEWLPKSRAFLYSDKEFRENTKAPENILGEHPPALRYNSMPEAIANLQQAVDIFFVYFETNPEACTLHPSFGMLDFNEWLMMHGKHVRHHLRQFGLLDA